MEGLEGLHHGVGQSQCWLQLVSAVVSLLILGGVPGPTTCCVDGCSFEWQQVQLQFHSFGQVIQQQVPRHCLQQNMHASGLQLEVIRRREAPIKPMHSYKQVPKRSGYKSGGTSIQWSWRGGLPRCPQNNTRGLHSGLH